MKAISAAAATFGIWNTPTFRRDFSVQFREVQKVSLLVLLQRLKVIDYRVYASNSHLHFVENTDA